MASIYELAQNGTLTEAALRGPALVEMHEFNSRTQLTPLGIAVWRGHVDVARLLLEYKVDPNGGRRGRPPLWVATLKTEEGPAGDVLVRLLLDHRADACLASQVAADRGTTPLYNAVLRHRSLDVVSRLVDAGASPREVVPALGRSAWLLADEYRAAGQLAAMRSRAERNEDRLGQTALVTGFVMGVVYLANKNLPVSQAAGAAAGVSVYAKDAILRRFNMTGWLDEMFAKYFSNRKTIQYEEGLVKTEFTREMQSFISDHKLDRFFPKGDSFLASVLERAFELQRDPDNHLDPRYLAHLALYQNILYCDDSRSMEGEKQKHQRFLVQRITSVATRMFPDGEGVKLRFINAATADTSRTSPAQVDDIMSNIKLGGGTKIGDQLPSKVLEDTVYQPLAKGTFRRPVLVSIITDGCPSAGAPEKSDSLKEAIKACGDRLEQQGFPRASVRFQITQIGADKRARKFLPDLKDPKLDDVLHVTTDSGGDDSRYLSSTYTTRAMGSIHYAAQR
ncbi:hypothetical protein V2A60_004470 [Cordyceps javanica]